MAVTSFDVAAAEKEAGRKAWFHRQKIGKTPQLNKQDAAAVANKTAIVTGSNTGLGLEAARQLLDVGLSKLIIAVRTVSKGEKAREELLKGRDPASCTIEVWGIDMLSYDSIVSFANRAKTLDQLHIAILNAGHYREQEYFTSDTGYEDCIQVNYLSTMLLAMLLLPLLKPKTEKSQPGRLVMVSSDMAAWTPFTEGSERPILAHYKKKSDKWDHAERYGTSKLLGQLFLSKLVEAVPASEVIVDLANPGMCYGTELLRDGDGRLLGYLYKATFRLLGKAPELGALAMVHAAVSFGEAAHGQYTEVGEIRPSAPLLYKAERKGIADQLWNETLKELSFAPVQEALQAFAA